jgi:Flp pilus assembly protein TadD
MLGQLLDRLRASHAPGRTLVVVTADHGESLGEHGETTHGLFAYDATIAVPLIIAGIGTDIGAGTGAQTSSVGQAVVDAPVAHMDIAPTILDLVGVRAPDGLDGQSLVQSPSSDRPLYFEALDAYLTRNWAPLSGVVQRGWKYIDLPMPELYDLSADPREGRNRIGSDLRGDAMRQTLHLAASRQTAGSPASVGQDAAARLRSLGYVGSSFAPSPSTGRRKITEADDPKRLVALNERFNSALTAFDDQRSEAALTDFLSILRDRPDFIVARTSAATALLAAGRSREALSLLRAAPPDQAESGELLAKLGAALRDAGDLSGAATAFERARRSGDQNAEIVNDLAVVYAGLGRGADARALFRELIARDPGNATTWYNLGLFELQAKQRREAAEAFQHAVDLDPAYGVAWQALCAALVSVDSAAAEDAWRHAERLLPDDYDLLFNLAMVLAESDEPADAIPYLRRFAAEAPRDRYAGDIDRVRAMITRLNRGRDYQRGPAPLRGRGQGREPS